ncbi:MAG: CHAT domain-containing protein, partial [Saprospiraceae bacterium]|nr:CHAT domain-containing protein [Saprospiraceae bacterium]
WPVKDGTTARFMEIFYQYLQEGDAKDVALRKAKLQFIEQGEAPYFWAAYVVNGDTVPIPFHRQSWSSYWWAGLLLVGGMIYYFIKMRNP